MLRHCFRRFIILPRRFASVHWTECARLGSSPLHQRLRNAANSDAAHRLVGFVAISHRVNSVAVHFKSSIIATQDFPCRGAHERARRHSPNQMPCSIRRNLHHNYNACEYYRRESYRRSRRLQHTDTQGAQAHVHVGDPMHQELYFVQKVRRLPPRRRCV